MQDSLVINVPIITQLFVKQSSPRTLVLLDYSRLGAGLLGPEHPDTLTTMGNMAGSLRMPRTRRLYKLKAQVQPLSTSGCTPLCMPEADSREARSTRGSKGGRERLRHMSVPAPHEKDGACAP